MSRSRDDGGVGRGEAACVVAGDARVAVSPLSDERPFLHGTKRPRTRLQMGHIGRFHAPRRPQCRSTVLSHSSLDAGWHSR